MGSDASRLPADVKSVRSASPLLSCTTCLSMMGQASHESNKLQASAFMTRASTRSGSGGYTLLSSDFHPLAIISECHFTHDLQP
ncbi:hypothetical protein [Kushneria phyllosphaerae]|uniref:hypothetical protein n=1 Tax=Kushneria phyllosphaerae TaxID=2100822 RepID=UPI001057C05F|nr:hypothetical protein [Kushneria phyllosphaerae]